MICPPDAERNFEVPFWVLDNRRENRETSSEGAGDGLRSTGEGAEGLKSGALSADELIRVPEGVRQTPFSSH
jgi:hypothetical protein